MQRAASNDFSLAVDYVGGTKKTVNQPSKVNTVQASSVKSATSEYLTESWVLEKRPQYWTIQMLAFNEEQKVRLL